MGLAVGVGVPPPPVLLLVRSAVSFEVVVLLRSGGTATGGTGAQGDRHDRDQNCCENRSPQHLYRCVHLSITSLLGMRLSLDAAVPGGSAHHPGITPGRVICGDCDNSSTGRNLRAAGPRVPTSTLMPSTDTAARDHRAFHLVVHGWRRCRHRQPALPGRPGPPPAQGGGEHARRAAYCSNGLRSRELVRPDPQAARWPTTSATPGLT